jgi:hypothetical protein
MPNPKRVATNGTKALTTTSAIAVAANKQRKFLEIGGSQTVGMWLGFGQAAVVGSGQYVPAGASYVMDDDNLFVGDIHAKLISGAGETIGYVELS